MSIASLAPLLLAPFVFALPLDPELEARRLEAQILNRAVDLHGLRAKSGVAARWMPLEPPTSRVTVLHIWSVDCPPCVAELPRLRDISREFRKSSPEVSFVFITETREEDRLQEFLRDHGKSMPAGEIYQSQNEQLRRSIDTTKQPITLLLDQHRVVRQAFVGSIAERRNEFVGAVERLLCAAK